MKPRTKETLKYLGASLINNDACIAGGRERPWYFALIIGILGTLLALTPIMTTYFTQTGATIVSSDTHGIDSYLIGFQEALYEDAVEMKVEEASDGSHYLVTNFAEVYAKDTGYPYFNLTREDAQGNTTTVFRAYYYGDIDNATLSERRNDVIDNYVSPNAAEGEETPYNVSTIFMSSHAFYFETAPYYGEGQRGTALYGDYDNLPVGCDIAKFAVESLNGTPYEVGFVDKAESWQDYYSASISNWTNFFDLAYKNTAYNTAWIQTGVSAAVYVAMAFFMGLMVFLMTRGKNNPFRIYTFWESQKIAYWAAFTPGLLSLVLGFILPNYALLMYVAIYGIRIVWLTMKSLRPAPSNN